MAWKFKKSKAVKTFDRGVHPPDQKQYCADMPIEVIASASKVVLPLLQNIGAPAKPIVKLRETVSFGQMVACGESAISTSLHTPIAGKVVKMGVTTLPNGRHVNTIEIEAEGEQIDGQTLYDQRLGGKWPFEDLDRYLPEQITDIIHDAGIVGLGGAAFPTHVKIAVNDKKNVDTLIVNGCECEPYLNTDYRLMIESPDSVIAGALLAKRAINANQVIIGIEDNKPYAIDRIKQAAKGTSIEIAVVQTKYPQGSERHLIKAIKNIIVPLGGLPADVGVAVSNVGTLSAVACAVLRQKPLTHRVVSVSGAGIARPKNLLVPLGISFKELISICGGLRPDAARVIAGGPMMGFAFGNLDTPVTKGTSGLTILTQKDISSQYDTVCIRCGRCARVCPMKLVPAKLALAAKYRNVELAKQYNIMACMETGCCGYICPARIPLVQYIRMGKLMVMADQRK